MMGFDDIMYESIYLLKDTLQKTGGMPLIHRILQQTVHCSAACFLNWLIQEKGVEAVSELDLNGNNVLMAIVSNIKRSIPAGNSFPLKGFEISKLLFCLLKNDCFDLLHANVKGETLLSLVIDLNEWSIAKEVLNEFNRRNVKVDEETQKKLENMITNKCQPIKQEKKFDLEAYLLSQ